MELVAPHKLLGLFPRLRFPDIVQACQIGGYNWPGGWGKGDGVPPARRLACQILSARHRSYVRELGAATQQCRDALIARRRRRRRPPAACPPPAASRSLHSENPTAHLLSHALPTCAVAAGTPACAGLVPPAARLARSSHGEAPPPPAKPALRLPQLPCATLARSAPQAVTSAALAVLRRATFGVVGLWPTNSDASSAAPVWCRAPAFDASKVASLASELNCWDPSFTGLCRFCVGYVMGTLMPPSAAPTTAKHML